MSVIMAVLTKHCSVRSKVQWCDEKAELLWTSSVPGSPPVWSVAAWAMKWQKRIGSRDLSAAISGPDVGQAERNGEHCMLLMISVACSALAHFHLSKCSSCMKFIIVVRRGSKATAHPIWGKICLLCEHLELNMNVRSDPVQTHKCCMM